MSRSSRQQQRNQQYAVSLFPFLAVLVCTLGVLIVMLVMAVQQADVESRDRKDEVAQEQQQQLKQAQDRRELAEFEADSIRLVRGDLTSRLQNAKADRSYLEQQIQETNRQAQDLFAQVSELKSLLAKNAQAKETLPASTEPDEELIRLEKEVKDAEESLKKLREDKSFETKNEYAIVPFTGSGGTHRQPIFVECVRDGLILQPYNIRLLREDFGQPLGIGNMLDAALLTVREYWSRHGLSGPDAKPYPLLVVRPDGAETYGLARRAMKSWDDEFGYELVSSDLELRFGEPDLQLKSEIEAAVEAAKRRQQRIASRRALNRDDQFKSTLQLARGLQPSASGGFETVGTGLPAHEAREAFAPASFEKSVPPKKSLTSDFASKPTKQNKPPESEADMIDDITSQFEQRNKEIPSAAQQLAQAQARAQRDQASAAQRRQQQGSGGQSSGRSLAETRGANWALPAKTTGAQAYVRPIRVICEPHQVILLSQGIVTAVVPLREHTVTSVDPLVSEIWETIESWGIAGRQAYWKPELRFSVLPGAERRFEELRVLFDNSGLEIEAADER